MGPGAIALNLIPYLPHSAARDLTKVKNSFKTQVKINKLLEAQKSTRDQVVKGFSFACDKLR